ncbi:hypothetical protein QVD17_11936 [Tagetes erecta]|uniref:Gag protein n=1 Tax=Tagetes erecta TaxID=13708 RepID=A0AAD8KUC8_TARER|nr:hypothetical protein QVD17_11936 [Tagetes erecta]
MSMSLTLADLESGSPNRPPKLINGDNFKDWKRRLKAFSLYTDQTQWDSIEKRPHLPVTTVGDATKNAKDLYDALCEFYDGNADLQKDKGVQAQKEFNSFMSLRNEKILDLTNRFLTVTSNLKKYDDELTTVEQAVFPPMQTQNAALLSSKSETLMNNSGFSYTSRNVSSERKNVGKDQVVPQVLKDMMALFGMFVNSYEALIARVIKGKGIIMEDMLQVDPDDLEVAFGMQ